MIVLFPVFWSFALSAAVVFYTLNPAVIALSAAVAFGGAWFFRDVRFFLPWDHAAPHGNKQMRLPAVFFLLSLAGILLLSRSAEIGALFSPWQAINPWFAPVFFLLTLVLGILLFSGHGTRMMLLFIIIHAFVQHLYLPMSHELPWGGDVWRHIAVEEKLARGEIVPPSFPEALLIPQKYTYGQLWGISTALSLITRLPLTHINRWLMPILWSVALPLLLFQLGVLLFRSRRSALALAALPVVSFPFQALGALTLPVSLGFLTFLFALLVWCRALETGEKKMKTLALTLAGLMLFSYALYFILIWFIIAVTWMVKYKKISSIMYLLSPFIFPAVEILSGFSRFPASFDWWRQAKQFIGQFSGWYYAFAIRPHDMLSGNIFFNHTPSYAFVENLFTAWRWWMIPAMLALWGIAAVGFFQAPKDRVWQALRYCSVMVFGGYLIGWYVLEGDRLFTRRLDLTLAFLAIIFFLRGIQYISHRYQLSAISYQLAAIVVFAFFATATYASGPDLRVVSREEYAAAQSAWGSERTHASPYCVLADTWVLLPLEAISAGKIVGGGFPIDRQFGQPERMRLYEAYRAGGGKEILEEATRLTGAKNCIGIP